MKEKVELLCSEIKESIAKAKTVNELNNLKVEYMGKKGIITELQSGIKDAADKKEYGMQVNTVRTTFNENYEAKLQELNTLEINKKLEKEKIDITLPATSIKTGAPNILEKVIEEVEEVCMSMGYDVVDGPEVEEDHYNFELLNIPKGHPARDMQDSFYITSEYLLRTQTSAVQARTMMSNTEKTPIRVICPGKTYRKEDDATHSHQFNQVEGLVIDKNISFADLKGTLEIFMRKMLGENTQLRFRPSYFPFTEPSAEMDVTCFKCGWKGCRFCKGEGWIEILGCGMVHPRVLRMSGIDPEEYSGFAFGIGLERIALLKYEIDDMRLLYENDQRFLNQF